MTRNEADELAGFIDGLIDCESVSVRQRRGTWVLVVRMAFTPPRTYSRYAAAFEAYCAGGEDG